MEEDSIAIVSRKIESMLDEGKNKSMDESDLHDFVSSFRFEERKYKMLRVKGNEKGDVPNDMNDELKSWGDKLMEIVNKVKRSKSWDKEGGEGDVMVETVRMLRKQLEKSDANVELLERSGLKLSGLNYTSADIQGKLDKIRTELKKEADIDSREIRMVWISIAILLLVSFVIIIDKLFF